MKHNKKLLMLFLAVNVVASANEREKLSKYENLYNKMLKNIDKNRSNKDNYKLIENVLKKRNQELKDLYEQNDYIVKPEYLEWQVFFSGYYAQTKKGDNTLENADFYSTAKTKSGKLTINSAMYHDLLASGLTENQIMALFNGENGVLRDLTKEQRKIFYNSDYDLGQFKLYVEKEEPNRIKLGASIPIKDIVDFSIDPKIDLIEKIISPVDINLPSTRVEKIMITDIRDINSPTPNLPQVTIEAPEGIVINSPTVNFGFEAGHNAGAPKKIGSSKNRHVSKVVNSIKHTGSSIPDSFGYYFVNFKSELFFSNETDFTFTSVYNSSFNKTNGRYYGENAGAAKILANYGKLTIGEKSIDTFIFGDTVDTVEDGGVFSTTVYNSGTMIINADGLGGQADVPAGIAMAYLSNGDDTTSSGKKGARQRYLVNGLDGIIEVNGWGNYGILMNQVDSLQNTNKTSITEIDINVLLNKGKVIISQTGRPNDRTEGNVGIAGFADNTVQTGNDNSFILNDSEGTITSIKGNNILLRQMGTGEVWNRGVLDIQSSETIGIDKRNWTFNPGAGGTIKNIASEAKGINDGVIIVRDDVENIKAVVGKAEAKKNDGVDNTDKTIIIKNGDGYVFGSDFSGNNIIGDIIVKNIDKGKLGTGGTITGSANIDNLATNKSPTSDIVADNTYLDNDLGLNNIRENKLRAFDIIINGKNYNYTTQDGVIFLGGQNSTGLSGEINNIGSSLNSDLVKVVNNIDGKIFIYSTKNTGSQYTIGAMGDYVSIENKGGIYLGLVPQTGFIDGLAEDVKTEGAVTTKGDYNYIGIFGKSSIINNTGFITDKATSDGKTYSQSAIGIYTENDGIRGARQLTNSGVIDLGIGGRGIIAKGTVINTSVTNTGIINVMGDSGHRGVGLVLNNADANISNEIGLFGHNTVGIYTSSSNSLTSNLEVNNLEIKGDSSKASGIVIENSNFKVSNGLKINLTGENNIGIFGDRINYINGASGNPLDYMTINLGKGGIGAYIKDPTTNLDFRANTITAGNSTTDKVSGGLYLVSADKEINITSGNIKIGSTLEDGKGFGIYLSGKTGESSKINLGTNSILVNEKSGIGIYGENVSSIISGDITSGNTGVYQENSASTAGLLKTGVIKLLGNENGMLGLYTKGNPINVEIDGLDMNALDGSTGIYIENGGFKNNGNISITSGNESYGAYIKGSAGNNNIDFGTGTTNMNLGNKSIGLYLEGANVISGLSGNITVGDSDSSSSGKQSIGLYAVDTTFNMSMPLTININSGSESIGAYFDSGTMNVNYSGNMTIGEDSLGIYKNGGTIKRDANSSLIFTGANNEQSTGYYLNNATLDFIGTLNSGTLGMNSGIAFLLKGNTAQVTVNGITITNAQLDSMGLAPKVERIVYAEKDETLYGDMTLDPSIRYYGYRAKDGRLEINGNIYTANGISSTYGAAVQGRFTINSVSEEILLKNGYTIDMSKSLGSVAMQSLAGARARNEGTIIVGETTATSAGIGILAESKGTDITSVINETNGLIEMPHAGIGIYLDSLELGGTVENRGTINSVSEDALGIYAKRSTSSSVGTPIATLTNSGIISLGNNGFGIFAENSIIENSGTIKVHNPSVNKIIALYGKDQSVINNTGGNISVGENGVAFFGNNTKINISGGTFNTENGTLIYAENGTEINYTAAGTVLGNKIGIYLEDSLIDFNGRDFTVLDSGSGLYMLGLSSQGKNLGSLTLGTNADGVYVKDAYLNNLGGTIKMSGDNSRGIIGKNSNIDNTTDIVSNISGSDNKGIIARANDGLSYTVRNKANINLDGINLLGIYASAVDGNKNVVGNLNIINEKNINLTSTTSIDDINIGMYGTAGVNLYNNIGGAINIGNYSVGMYSSNGNIYNESNINVGDAGVGLYISGGTGFVNSSSVISIGNGLRKIDSFGKEVIESGVAFYVSNGGTLDNHATNISVGRDSIVGYSTGIGSKITNYGAINLGEEAIGFYASLGEIENNATLSSSGNGIIYFYGKDGKLLNNGDIQGSAHNYGVGMYGNNSQLINNGNIYLGDTYFNPAMEDYPSDSSHRYAVGIYGERSSIYNNGTIEIGERGIGIYSYNQTGNIVNDINGKIISSKDNAVGFLVEGGGGYDVINRGEVILSGSNSVGASINRNSRLINESTGKIIVSGTNSVAVIAEANSTVVNHGIISSEGSSTASILLRGSSTLENYGTINGLALADKVSTALDEKSTSAVTIANSADYEDRVPGSVMPSYEKPTIINSGTIYVDNNFILDGIHLVIKPDLESNPVNIVTDGDSTIYYNAVKINGGKIENNMLVEVTPDFAEGISAETIKLMKTFTGSNLDIKTFDVISQSIMWKITPAYNDNNSTEIDLIAKKKTFESFSTGLWYDNFGTNLDRNYFNSEGNALKIYNKMNWLSSEKELRHIMSSLAGNVYANINQREMNIASILGDSINSLQASSNNTKENVKLDIITAKGKLKDDTDGIVEYDYTTTGVVALREVERTYRHTFGYSLGFAQTNFDLDDGNDSKEKANTIQLGLHNRYELNGYKFRSNLMGSVSFRDMERNIMWPTKAGKSELEAKYEVYSINFDNTLGKEFEIGKNVSLTPYGGIKAVYLTRPSFSEKGLEALDVDGNDAWSVRPRVGIETKVELPLGKRTMWKLKGTLDLAYEYELADMNKREFTKLKEVEDTYHRLSKPEEEDGIFRTKATLGVEVEGKYGVFITGEYLTGDDNKEDYRAGVSLKAVF